jgi:hypothetical protein
VKEGEKNWGLGECLQKKIDWIILGDFNNLIGDWVSASKKKRLDHSWGL